MVFADGSLASYYTLAEWTIRVSALAVVPFRRSPDSARAWLLLLLFLPVPGLILYLLIGRPTYTRRRRDLLVRATKQLHAATKEVSHSRHCRQPNLPVNFRQAALLIEKLGRFPALGGNSVQLVADYEASISRLISDIDNAEHHVHLLTYIFADDHTGRRVMEALSRAAQRGVRCRVLIDAMGSRPSIATVNRRLSTFGIVVAEALPVGLWRRASARADLRNHRKIGVIDGSVGYVGSQNICDASAGRGLVNTELVARVAGPVVAELQAVFALDWCVETDEVIAGEDYFRHLDTPDAVTAQLMPSGPDYGEAGLGPLTIALIHAARERVIITTPYFIPDAALLQALRTAALRGVIVHLVVPLATDHILVRLAQQSYYAELLEAGVQIHRYRSGFLHAKHISVDREVTIIGSSNVDVRSYVLNAEVTLITYDRRVTAELWIEQQRYLASSDELTSDGWDRRPLGTKLAENLARLVSPLL